MTLTEARVDVQIPNPFAKFFSAPTAIVTTAAAAQQRAFRQLADQWYEETKFSSDTMAITSNDAYRRIVAMGEPAVPLILQELAKRGGDWFTALEKITHASPVAKKDHGYPSRMRDAWLEWGRTTGHRV
ncbi:MAG: hypothetical protein ACYC9W_01110 [Candidatus Limnocylindria bacterium]